ncbi:MAG: hypothetical protein AAFV93_08970 [Chloroflexota bacterium]
MITQSNSAQYTWHKATISFLICSLLMLVGCSPSNPSAEAQAVVIENLATLNPDNLTQHPRIFFTSDNINTLQRDGRTSHEAIVTSVINVADDALTRGIAETPTDASILNHYRIASHDLLALSFACVMTDTESYCDGAKERLLTYITWSRWGETEKPELAYSHLLMMTAISYDWLYNNLTNNERNTIRTELLSRTQALYYAGSSPNAGAWWQESYYQNHYSTANSALGIASLVLLDDTNHPMTCELRPSGSSNVNLRLAPTLDSEVGATLERNQTAITINTTIDREGSVWYELSDGLYVRSDVVRPCSDDFILNPQRWLNFAVEQMQKDTHILENIGDGTWHESIPYQAYKLTMSLPFTYNLRSLTDVDIIPHTYMQAYPQWMLYNWLPNGDYILSFADFQRNWETDFAHHSLVRFSASEYDDSVAEWLAQQMVATSDFSDATMWSVFEFFYYNPEIEAQAPTDMPLSYQSTDLEAIIWRTGWTENDLVFGMKASAFGGNFAVDSFLAGDYPWQLPCNENNCQLNIDHDHNDAGTYYLYNNNTWMTTEIVGLAQIDTALHNALLINNMGQYRPPNRNFGMQPTDFDNRAATIAQHVSSTNVDYARADLTNAYPDEANATQVERHALFIRPDYIVLLDIITSSQAQTYQAVSHYQGDTVYIDSWIESYPNEQIIGLNLQSDNSLDVTLSENSRTTSVTVSSTDPSETFQLATLLYPASEEEWQNRPTLTINDNDGETIWLQVDWQDGRSEQIFINYLGESITLGDYETDAQVLVLSQSEGATQFVAIRDDCFAEGILNTLPSSTCN